jgi:hypothetical protein
VESILLGLIHAVIRALLKPLDFCLTTFATAGELHDLFAYPGVHNLITGAQALAGAILATRAAWEAVQLALIRNEGGVVDISGFVKRVGLTAAAIAGGPWVAKQALLAGNMLAQAVAHAGLTTGLDQIDRTVTSSLATFTIDTVFTPFLLVFAIVIIFLCFAQSMVRTIEMTLAAILSPLMALGFMSGGGSADVWWREVIVVASSQAVQMMLLYLAASLLVAPLPGTATNFVAPFLFAACCWVAFRTPHILRTYAYSTGVGSAAVGAAAGVAGQAATRLILSRLPF